ncbi:MAG: hypothetical protein ABIP29_04805 [Candidatus Eisenbacteria bacterium]
MPGRATQLALAALGALAAGWVAVPAAWPGPQPIAKNYVRDGSVLRNEVLPGTSSHIHYATSRHRLGRVSPSFGDRVELRVFTFVSASGPVCDSIDLVGVIGVDDLPVGLTWPLLGLASDPDFNQPLVVDAELLGDWFGCATDDETHTLRMVVVGVDSARVGQSRPWVKAARLGLAALRRGEPAEAARLLEPGARRRPRDLVHQCLYAAALEGSGQRAAYDEQVRNIAESSPDRLDASRLRGWR